MAVKLNSTGGGSVTLDSPSTASNYTVTLPSAAGTLATTTGTGSVFTNPTINGFTGDTTAITIGTTQFVKDTSGNIGIGTSSPNSFSIQGAPVLALSGTGASLVLNDTSSSSKWALLGRTGASTNQFRIYDVVSAADRLVIDSSGNVGLGVTPSGYKLQVAGSIYCSNAGSANITVSEGTYNSSIQQNSTNLYFNVNVGSASGGAFFWRGTSAASTLMLLDASGNLIVGDTSNISSVTRVYSKFTGGAGATGFYSLQAGAGGYCYSSNAALNGSTYYHFIFNDAGVSHGSITSNGTNTAYNQSSDQRLKIDLGQATKTSVIDDTVIHDFEWKSTGTKARGVFAQEAQEVNPNAVTPGQSDELNEDGLPVHPWGVDYSKYVPDLIVYCQQLKAQNNALEARLAQLEAK